MDAETTTNVRMETEAERKKWLAFYREYDVLVAEGERERETSWFPNR